MSKKSKKLKGPKKQHFVPKCYLSEFADIITDPRYTNEEFPLNRDEYFPKTQVGQEERVQDEDRSILKVKVKFMNKVIDRPLYKNDLVNIPGLDLLSVITMPRATNFKVTESEWKIISKLISAY